MNNDEITNKLQNVGQQPHYKKKKSRDVEVTPKTFIFGILFGTIIIVVISVFASGFFNNQKKLDCICNPSPCICPNITIPENICNGVTINPPQVNITHEISLPTCILSGCNRTEVISKCLSQNMELNMKVHDANGTVVQENLMSYLGNGIYKKTYGDIEIEILIGD